MLTRNILRQHQCLSQRLTVNRSLPLRQQVQTYSTQTRTATNNLKQGSNNGGGGGKRFVQIIIGATLIIGVASWSFYPFLSGYFAYPQPVRQKLRQGLRSKQKGDYDEAAQSMNEALSLYEKQQDESSSLSLSSQQQELKKLSGIKLALGDVLEEGQNLEEAFNVYYETYKQLKDNYESNNNNDDKNNTSTVKSAATSPDGMRAISISQKLGQVSENMESKQHEDIAREAMEWSLVELLKKQGITKQQPQNQTPLEYDAQTKLELGSCMENLAGSYARNGQHELAVPLYLQVLSVLLSPSADKASLQDRCHSATIMNNISTSITAVPNETRLKQGESWTKKALDFSKQTLDTSNNNNSEQVVECEQVLAVARFNLGMIAELQGNKEKARKHYQTGREQSRRARFKEGLEQADFALKRLDQN